MADKGLPALQDCCANIQFIRYSNPENDGLTTDGHGWARMRSTDKESFPESVLIRAIRGQLNFSADDSAARRPH